MVHGSSFASLRPHDLTNVVRDLAEPMTDLFALFSKLVTPAGEILVPGIADNVAPLTAEERARYEVIDITVADFESAAGAKVTLSQDKATTLMGRMRYPRCAFTSASDGGMAADEVLDAVSPSMESRVPSPPREPRPSSPPLFTVRLF